MVETFQRILFSQHPWSAAFFLVVGVIGGVYLTLKAQRPKLLINGDGSGGGGQQRTWTIAIYNRPSFLGVPFNGETAHDIRASIAPTPRGNSYQLYWSGSPRAQRTTLGPGEHRHLEVFSWFAGTRGYCVVDHAQEPVARFDSRELEFTIEIQDRLERTSRFPVTVLLDDTHLKNTPQLKIRHPLSMRTRWHIMRGAFREARAALGRRT